MKRKRKEKQRPSNRIRKTQTKILGTSGEEEITNKPTNSNRPRRKSKTNTTIKKCAPVNLSFDSRRGHQRPHFLKKIQRQETNGRK